MGAVAALSAQAFNQALLASSWFLQEESDLEDLVDFSTITHSLIGHNFVMPFLAQPEVHTPNADVLCLAISHPHWRAIKTRVAWQLKGELHHSTMGRSFSSGEAILFSNCYSQFLHLSELHSYSSCSSSCRVHFCSSLALFPADYQDNCSVCRTINHY